jgi:TolA-binding protein
MRRRWYAAGGIVAVLVVGACSHSSGGGSDAAGSAGLPLGGAAQQSVNGGGVALAPARTAPHGTVNDLSNGGLTRGAADLPIASSGGGTAKTVNSSLPLVNGGYKIEVARMTVAVKGAANVANQANQATAIAEQVGGEVDRDDRTSGPHASASMLLRVPPDQLDHTLTLLSGLGIEKYRSQSVTDVTQRVADVSSRVHSAQESIARLRVLFQHATKIGAIIEIESELNSREADLESLEAQQRALARETSMASITLALITAAKKAAVVKPPAKKHSDNAFVAGLKHGWDGFTDAAAWIAKAIGTLLPFIVLIFVLGFGLRLAWPRLRRGGSPTPAPTPSE